MIKMRNALDEMVVEGIKTNISLHRRIVRNADIQQGGVDIHYLEKLLAK